jgi:LacI family transcriptional regulator
MVKNKVGLKVLASELGLSITAVSRALRDCDDISYETKQLVKQKAIEIGYLPNSVIKVLNDENKKVIGFVLDSFSSPFIGMILNYMVQECKDKDISCLIFPSYQLELTQPIVEECARQSVGVIISFIVPNKESTDFANMCQMPIIVFGRDCKENVDVICTDDYQGGALVAEYFHDLGLTKLGYIGAPHIMCDSARYLGFKDTALKLGYSQVLYIDSTKETLSKIFEYHLDGVFAFNDELACKALNCGDDCHFKVVGYDGLSKNLNYPNEITSVVGDYQAMAKETIAIALKHFDTDYKLENRINKKYPVFIQKGRTA